jgi:hypothetical protein
MTTPLRTATSGSGEDISFDTFTPSEAGEPDAIWMLVFDRNTTSDICLISFHLLRIL